MNSGEKTPVIRQHNKTLTPRNNETVKAAR